MRSASWLKNAGFFLSASSSQCRPCGCRTAIICFNRKIGPDAVMHLPGDSIPEVPSMRYARFKRFRRFSIRILGILLISLFASCQGNACQKDDENEVLYLLGLLQPLGDYWARLYYVDPLVVGDEENINFIREAQPSDTFSGQKKLILVSGWDTSDRSDVDYPSPNDLERRALVTKWNHLFKTTDYDNLLLDGYQVFIFDYLTSDSIALNGSRFRYWLDRTFGSVTSQEVIIYAHSMGGIVTRTALYQGSTPLYLRAALINGSPLHGSPGASPEYQESKSFLGALASFITQTDGGSDLRWDNFDGNIAGASNPFLTELAAKSGRDHLIHLTYGDIDDGNSFDDNGSVSTVMQSACLILHSPEFRGDCIVPITSSQYSGVTNPNPTTDLGRYEHFQINWASSGTRSALRTKINSL